MEFQFKEYRNKETLLTKYSEEDLMSALGIPIVNGRFTSPFREDNKPDCVIFRSSSGRLYYMDWAEFDKPMDIFSVCMLYNNITFVEAINFLWERMEGTSSNIIIARRLERESIIVVEASDIRVESRNWLASDIKWWNQFGITLHTLKIFRIEALLRMIVNGITKYLYYDGIYPAYTYHLGNALKIYFPYNRDFRFRTNDGKAVQGWAQLPETGDVLVITKSLKDVMTLYEYGISAIAPQSETIVFSDEVLQQLNNRFTTIIVLFDNDRTGKKGLLKWRKKEYDVCMIPRAMGVKDISDFRKRYGHEMTVKIIAQAREYYLRTPIL